MSETVTAQLIQSWQINNRINLMILDELDDAGLQTTLSTRGGRTVGHQLAHLIQNRQWKIESIEKSLIDGFQQIGREDGHSPDRLREGFEQTGTMIETMVRSAMDNGGYFQRGFKRGAVVLIGYLISHESHHRGHMFLTLKQSGYKLDNAFRARIWSWNTL